LIGFELEMKVSLSAKGKGRVTTVKDLKAMKASELKDDQAFEVEDGTVYGWDTDPGMVGIKKSFALNEGGKGRWIEQPRGSRISTERDPAEHLFFDPLLDKGETVSKASGSQPFSVVEDFDNQIRNDMTTDPPVRSAHTAIAELVTEPRDEFLEPGEFLKPMAAAAKAAATIEMATGGLRKRIPAKTVFSGAGDDFYLGVDLGPKEKDFQTTAANVQASFGVQLAGVPELFRGMAESKGRGLDEKRLFTQSAKVVSGTVGTAGEQGVRVGPRLAGLLHFGRPLPRRWRRAIGEYFEKLHPLADSQPCGQQPHRRFGAGGGGPRREERPAPRENPHPAERPWPRGSASFPHAG